MEENSSCRYIILLPSILGATENKVQKLQGNNNMLHHADSFTAVFGNLKLELF